MGIGHSPFLVKSTANQATTDDASSGNVFASLHKGSYYTANK
eukprot:CAMPEP_0176365448 /NCGR_PEP_ID=MMETSP0126-20121128/20486_1 /TAXON_ID=141414 ORGANISM="Strombidinopsis acuminatum, Strain SPMC142" /NCGR_SAMPLE_ID=MMETSP0126 /ASSEMBLY_ACC=CAM_ASM_000229 /LENGTH=41 /DNA_ID= /DNA_START= /DNA_END= /DNA_ORIENTATION=